MAAVVTPQRDGQSGMAAAVWPRWYGYGGMVVVEFPQRHGHSCMAALVCLGRHECSGISPMLRQQRCGIICMAGVQCAQWHGRGGTAVVVWPQRHAHKDMVAVVCRQWDGESVVVVVVVVVVKAPSTCRREKLPDTLSLGRAQGSSRPASRWPGVCRQRPRGGGGAPWSGGGGGARGGGGGHLWKLPCSPPTSRGGRVTRPVRSGCGGGGGRGGDLGVGKARPGPRTVRALPEHPAEVAVPRVRPWRGRGRWPVLLAFYGGEGRPGSCGPTAPGHLCLCCGVAASSPVVRARARVGHWGGRAQGRAHKSTIMGIQLLACRVRFRCCPLVPVSCLREAARHSRQGVEARAGRLGSGGRPRRTRRHAGAGPVAVAGGCGRSSRRSAVALSAPHSGVGGRAGGGRVLQAKLQGARAQGRRRARCGPLCGPRDLR